MFFPARGRKLVLSTEAGGMSIANFVIRTAQPQDFEIICSLHHRAFGDEKIPRLVDALLKAPAAIAPISLVAASVDSEVIGHILLSAGRLDASKRLVDVMTLSPLAVSQSFRKRGIGAKLIESALAGADALGIPLVFLEGDPAYYSRRGFEKASALGFRSPSLRIPDRAFQVARLSAHEPWMTGTFIYSEIFWAHDCVGLR
jgi:putative acetyltransferase